MPDPQQERLTLPDGQTIGAAVIRKAVKRLTLRIRPDGSLALTVPRGLSRAAVLAFLADNAARIARKRDGILARPHAPVTLDARDGDTILCFGRALRVAVLPSARPRCVEENETLFVYLPDPADDEARRKLLARFQREVVLREMQAQCVALFPYFSRHGVAYPTVRVNHTRAQWGSCLPDKHELHFSTALFFAPRPFLTYVAAHELTHLLCPDHGPAFYAHLAAVLPDHREARRLAPVLGASARETEKKKER
ncbi:MAG: M48 family metallopeptidase [Clostridia bacterium]|nr:M48 family metallopeptidase [Clostridia bacterium]